MMTVHRRPLAQRLWEMVDVRSVDECWPFLGRTDKAGYGRLYADGSRKHVFAHVAAWIGSNGALGVPAGKIITHSCDNPPCCNPLHLNLGTHKTNAAEREERGRGCRSLGEQNHQAKLTACEVAKIKRDIAADAPLRPMARALGISISTLCAIKSGKTWRHIAALAAVILLVSACSLTPPTPIVTAAPALAPPPRAAPPAPAPLSLRHTDWSVLAEKGKPALFCTDAAGYGALSVNAYEVLRWVGQARAVIEFYRSDAAVPAAH